MSDPTPPPQPLEYQSATHPPSPRPRKPKGRDITPWLIAVLAFVSVRALLAGADGLAFGAGFLMAIFLIMYLFKPRRRK